MQFSSWAIMKGHPTLPFNFLSHLRFSDPFELLLSHPIINLPTLSSHRVAYTIFGFHFVVSRVIFIQLTAV